MTGARHGVGDQPAQTVVLDRLDEVAVGADLARFADEHGIVRRRHHDHGTVAVHRAIRFRTSTPPSGRILISSSTTSGRNQGDGHERIGTVRGVVHRIASARSDALRISQDSTSSSTINTRAGLAIKLPYEQTPPQRVLPAR